MKKFTGKLTAIYARRSVSDKDKDNNSLSIDSQIADCVNSLTKGEEHRIYCDDGKSAKDIANRPAFQQMMSDAKEGLITKIIVKKYDRFSRNMRDYLNVTNTLDGYGVGISSLTEPFNTATKEGRMMRNTLLNFAEFERETIAARVTDAYITRSTETGFYQGVKIYFGYKSERRTVHGKTGSVLVPSAQSEAVKIMYDLYQNPKTSLQDIINHFRDYDGEIKIKMDRSHISMLLKSPLYVRADKEVYQYLISKGYEVIDDIEAFDGVHGLFRHSRKGSHDYIKVGYHEGLVDSETWLAVQDKKANNVRIPKGDGSKNSWLSGITKCLNCGYALSIQYSYNADGTKRWRYWLDRGAYKLDPCPRKRTKIKPDETEQLVFTAMKKRLKEMEIAKRKKSKPNPETESLKSDIIRLDEEIRKLLDKLANADEVLFEYIQGRVKSLHEKKSELEEKLRIKARKHKEIDTAPLTDPMSRWDSLTVEEKNTLATTMIEVVYISDENGVDIRFSI
ncbi:MAG: recombinase family protein [Oscillospiraceae bacterium]|jgi:DNA invertase Pin-like site-specific DNA recombinase|nr:recombinase family protein [Oscillospiraceae bacterium]